MSAWPGKYIIGLTGNIAMGKSIVRRMLEHLGAYGIDADALSHRAIARGAPGYQKVVAYFGKWILDSQGQISRDRLGRLVFADPTALAKLESIVHPLVRQGIDLLTRRASQKVVVIEAIKLLEGDLKRVCDSIWVVDATPEVQRRRLVAKRGMTEYLAEQRISAQSPQSEKLAVADVIISNNGDFQSTWNQVSAAWKKTCPKGEAGPVEVARKTGDQLSIHRAGPAQAADIARLIARLTNGGEAMTTDEVMAAFGEKAFLVVSRGNELVGLLGWQVENLVSRTTDFYLDPRLALTEVAPDMITEVEKASRELQSEASLLFLPPDIARHDEMWKALGYARVPIERLTVRAWQDAARESFVDNTVLLFKQLRKDRVLRPI